MYRDAMRDSIAARGFVVIDNVLSKEESLGLRGCMKVLFNKFGHLPKSATHTEGIRSDATHGVSEAMCSAEGLHALARSITLLKAFANEVAELHDASLTAAPNVQVACFARPGSNYGRHGDNMYQPNQEGTAPSGFRNWRAWTIILYPNCEWERADGGCLRIYNGGGEGPPRVSRMLDTVPPGALATETRYEDVEPTAGRLLIFNSLIPHEVLPCWKPRFAATLWVWKQDANADKFHAS